MNRQLGARSTWPLARLGGWRARRDPGVALAALRFVRVGVRWPTRARGQEGFPDEAHASLVISQDEQSYRIDEGDRRERSFPVSMDRPGGRRSSSPTLPRSRASPAGCPGRVVHSARSSGSRDARMPGSGPGRTKRPGQVARGDAEGRRLPQLLGNPGVGGVARAVDADDPARAEFDDEEREERPEFQGDELEEVAGPDRLGVVADEGGPGLAASR